MSFTWRDVSLAGVSSSWNSISVGKGVTNAIAGNAGSGPASRLVTSLDGDVWTAHLTTEGADAGWTAVASSALGTVLIAVATGKRLYVSTDSGNTWAERQPAGNADRNWGCVACSNTGDVLLAGVYDGRLYRSTNYGATWVETQPAGNVDKLWAGASFDATGVKPVVIAYGGVGTGNLYVSEDTGASWVSRFPDNTIPSGSNNGLVSVACSGDGSILLVGSNAWVYSSDDRGLAWTRYDAQFGSSYYSYVAVDSSGLKMLVAQQGARLWVSVNRGLVWTEEQPGGNLDIDWNAVTSDASGSNLYVGDLHGKLYTTVVVATGITSGNRSRAMR